MIRTLGLTCFAAWLIFECVRVRRFGGFGTEIARAQDVARRRWFGGHPVILVFIIQALIIGLAPMFVLPVLLVKPDYEAAYRLTSRSVFLIGVSVFVAFDILRLVRSRRAGLPVEYLKLQAMSLAAWFVGFFLTFA